MLRKSSGTRSVLPCSDVHQNSEMSGVIQIALVGLGKIARDQHLPIIMAHLNFELACVVSRSGATASVPVFNNLEAALSSNLRVDAVVLCTPPNVRLELIETALQHGRAVMLEKPPASTLEDAQAIQTLAGAHSSVVFASWHSRYGSMIEEARQWLSSRRLKCAEIIWHESAQKWHPDQAWLWQSGGFGVFDPGINALSILTLLNPAEYCVTKSVFEVPENTQSPIAVQMQLETDDGACIEVDLDFRDRANEMWTITLETETNERLELLDGGAELVINGRKMCSRPSNEYRGVYQHFAELLYRRTSEVDIRPLAIVTRAYEKAEIKQVTAIKI